MYMVPIDLTDAQRLSPMAPPAPAALRRLAGMTVILIAAPVMAMWLVLHATAATTVLGVRAALQAIDYAGTVALGR